MPAIEDAKVWQVALGPATGSVVLFVGDRLIARIGGKNRTSPDGTDRGDERGGDDSGLGIVLGTVLDGIAESAVLGMSLVGGGGVSVALLAGI